MWSTVCAAGHRKAQILTIPTCATGLLVTLLSGKQDALDGSFIAELLSDSDPDALLERSRTRLRRVPMHNISLELLGRDSNATPEEVQELTECCQLHDIDYFIT